MLTWILSIILSLFIVSWLRPTTTIISHLEFLVLFVIWTAISYLFIDVTKNLIIELYRFIKRL